MIMRHQVILAMVLPPLAALGGTSASYTLAYDAIDNGGLRGTSASYTVNLSLTPGGAGSSPSYTTRTGSIGQLNEVIALAIHAIALAIDETGTRQFSANLLLDDGTRTVLPATSIVWSIQGGPLDGIDANGLATAGPVYQNTSTTVQASYAGSIGTLAVNVLETIPDNFGSYAGDGLPDSWQVQSFGLDNPNAGPAADADGDGIPPLLELAFDTDPNAAGTGPGTIAYEGGVITEHGQPTTSVANIPNGVDFRAVFGRRKDYLSVRLAYAVQFSSDLMTWVNSTDTPVIIASDAVLDLVSVPYPFFVNGSKARFFRVSVSLVP
jgi:hypothetical protein